MGQIFDFSGIEKSEKSIKKTWQEFRDALSKGDFSFDDIASAKKNTFLKVYDDLFNKNVGIEYNTVLISEIKKYCVGRGTILGEDENPKSLLATRGRKLITKRFELSTINLCWHRAISDPRN